MEKKKRGRPRKQIITLPLDEKKDLDQAATNDPPNQGELIKEEQEPQPAVVKGRIAAKFLKPIFGNAPKSGDRLISLCMVVMLTKEHDDDNVVPSQVKSAWHFIAKHDRKRVDISVPGQIVKFYLAHDDKDEQLVLPAAKVTNCSIAVVQKKGEGEAVKQIRLSWRYQVPWSKEVERFAASNYGPVYWIVTKNTEESLFDEEEESDE